MLQALIQSKLKLTVAKCEDTQTSSTLGLLQYLPSDVFWEIFYNAQARRALPEDIGRVLSVSFWPKLSPGEKSSNSYYVEPDVLIESEYYHIIIEAKRSDEGGQNRAQWENEIGAVRQNIPDNSKSIFLIALGGNSTLEIQSVSLEDDTEVLIYPVMWLQLLHSVHEYSRQEGIEDNCRRLLNDIIEGFAQHGYFDLKWLDKLEDRRIIGRSLPLGSYQLFSLQSLFPRSISKQGIDLLWTI